MTYPMVSKAPRYDLNAPQLRDLLLAMIPTPDDVLAGLASGTCAPMAMPEACRDRHDLVAAAAGYESVANVHSRGLAKLRAAAESFRGVDPCDSDQYILVVESDKDRLRNALHTLEDVMRERGWTVTAGTAYSNPLLWEHAKREAVRRLGGRHSARAMQLAGRLYREAGGGYRGPRTAPQRSMARWTSERWTTATGEKACRKTPRGVRCDRYLPAEAWERLSPQEADATRRVKLRSPRQYVANAPAAREAAREAKRRG